MHEVLVNRLGGLSLPRKSVVRLTDRPDMTLDVYRGRKTTKQQSSINLQKDTVNKMPVAFFQWDARLFFVGLTIISLKTMYISKFLRLF